MPVQETHDYLGPLLAVVFACIYVLYRPSVLTTLRKKFREVYPARRKLPKHKPVRTWEPPKAPEPSPPLRPSCEAKEQPASVSGHRIVSALFVSALLATAGYFVGQYAPFTGLAPFGEPFSPVRDQAALSYAIVAGIIGIFIGLSAKPPPRR